MLEKTSTSSSAAAGASADDLFRSSADVDSVGNSSGTATAQALNFSSGNPRIEEITGVMHLFRNDAASSSDELPVERNPLICVLGVPNHTTYADFCQFCGPFIQHMLEMRIVRTEGLEDRYSVLIRLDDQKIADSFYKQYNGKCFSSLEEETCRMFFTVDIQYTGSIEHAQPSPASSTESPSCPVCLDKLGQDTAGILTTICNHSFHCSCMSKWSDSSCPVCRYCQQQPEKSICYVCQTSENLWMCLICGFVGCGRYRDGHSIGHWRETEHCYSLELETQRVWDYAGDNYVHRLIQSKTDGKLVELNHHCTCHNNGFSDCTEHNATLDNEVDYIKNEYNELLTSQLESQKNYFESLLQEVEEDTERESSMAIRKALSENPKLLKLQRKVDKCMAQKKFLDEINDNLLSNQSIWESKIVEIEEREKRLLQLKDKKIEELEEQLRSLMTCLETRNAEQEQHPKTSDEPSDSNSELLAAETSAVSAVKKTNSRRKKK
ncbi:zinc finger RING family protein [Perilla frutescens var. hirtella]|nr:zinc finger RING family protein [Perilla frutescens var. frutescens]KAH6794883.1 zinc finger RING family protein [Perilla frutescens var. hirtella]